LLHLYRSSENQDATIAFARLLLDHGTDATVQENNGYTALHWLSFESLHEQ